jgi:hypothetical protein
MLHEQMKIRNKVFFLLFLLFGLLAFGFLAEYSSAYGVEAKEITNIVSNESLDSASGKHWRNVESWTLTLVAAVPFSFTDLLKSLRDNYDKQQDGPNRTPMPENNNKKARLRKRTRKLRKFLEMSHATVLWNNLFFLLSMIAVSVIIFLHRNH